MSLREKFAAVQHDIWSYWMKYMFSVGQFLTDGSWLMPADKVERWQRQMNTPYTLLSEKERASDLRQADKVLKVMAPSRLEKIKARYSQYYLTLAANNIPFTATDHMQLRLAITRNLQS